MNNFVSVLVVLLVAGSLLLGGCGAAYQPSPIPTSLPTALPTPSTTVTVSEAETGDALPRPDDELLMVTATGFIRDVSTDPLAITFVEATEGIEGAKVLDDCKIAYVDGRPAQPQDLKPGTLVTAQGACYRGMIEAKVITIR